MHENIVISESSIRTQSFVTIACAIGGSLFLALLAQLAIHLPFTPVPITMQTLGIALLGMTMGGKRSAYAVLAYLAEATAGLPVLAGGESNPMWIIGPRAGYLLSFMITAYLTGSLLSNETKRPFWQVASILLGGQAFILAFGATWISLILGMDNALMIGVLPFIPGAILKAAIASGTYPAIKVLRS